MKKQHDIHDFLLSTQRLISEEYNRIQKRAPEDPGTAGDQGEENWATVLKNWLPSYFHIVTKGRILCDNGYTSPQIDILVLHPSYPRFLLDKKLYLAGGVAAAFECKITLKATHVKKAVLTASNIKKNLPQRIGTPYRELNSSIIYGLLAHSHSWKGERSKPVDNINNVLVEADKNHVNHPKEQIDYICIADLGTWQSSKITFKGSKNTSYDNEMKRKYGVNGSAVTTYCAYLSNSSNQQEYFTPLGNLLAGLYSKLSWQFTDMRELNTYFSKVDMIGSGNLFMRSWAIDVYSKKIRAKVYKGKAS